VVRQVSIKSEFKEVTTLRSLTKFDHEASKLPSIVIFTFIIARGVTDSLVPVSVRTTTAVS